MSSILSFLRKSPTVHPARVQGRSLALDLDVWKSTSQIVEEAVRAYHAGLESDSTWGLLFGGMIQNGSLWVPEKSDVLFGGLLSISELLSSPLLGYTYGFDFSVPQEPPPLPPPEVDFETNMMEALVGWKSWYCFDIDDEFPPLRSNNNFVWHPLEAAEAQCKGYFRGTCNKIPAEHHTCGIYAVDSRDGVMDADEVVGQVYGWGRYIRGDNGWRSQYAYPKSFHLSRDQGHLVDRLAIYGVPIYLDMPIQVFVPEGNGYEHGQDDTNGDSGAAEESGAKEDRDAGDYEG